MFTTLLNQPMQGVDESVTRGLSQFLFKGDAPFGLDLISLNIQRGRDWALRPYNDYLSAIGFQKVRGFDHYGAVVSILKLIFWLIEGVGGMKCESTTKYCSMLWTHILYL